MDGLEKYSIHAIRLFDAIRLKDVIEKIDLVHHEASSEQVIYRLAENSYWFIYSYGTVVFFNVEQKERTRLIGLVKTQQDLNVELPSTEDYVIKIDKTLDDISIGYKSSTTPTLDFPQIKLVCMVLAQSAALDYYETIVEDLLSKTTLTAKHLKDKGKILGGTKSFMRFIGFCLTVKQEIISNMYILDFPDETWDSEKLYKLYQQMSTFFEMNTRYKALEYKLKIIQESQEIIADLVSTKYSQTMELIIIFLIAFEILMAFIK